MADRNYARNFYVLKPLRGSKTYKWCVWYEGNLTEYLQKCFRTKAAGIKYVNRKIKRRK